MKVFRFLINTLFIQSIFVSLLYGQIYFDVKTQFQDKSQLKFVKIAVINNLQNSNWAKVTEIGENYSLWLTNLRRIDIRDSIHTEFDFDLRTPALLSYGNHILSKHISITFDTTGISSISNGADTLLTSMIIQGLQSTEVYSDMLKLASSLTPVGSILFKMFADKFFAEFLRIPTPLEQLESNLLAGKVEIELYKIFINAKGKL